MSMRCAQSIRMVIALAGVAAANGAEVYVNAGAVGPELGTPLYPYRSVQSAIDAAGEGDTVRVAAGTYIENIRVVTKRVTLEGGYSGDWARDAAANATTLRGAGGDAVVTLLETSSTIDGFRITGGTGGTELQPDGYHGGGVYCRGGSPTISNNVIENNDIRTGAPPFDTFLGGGVYVSDAVSVAIVNNVVRGNVAGRGAGLAVFGQEALIAENTIENNIAVGDHGGGVYLGVVEARVTSNVIRSNEVGREVGYGWGGGLIVVNDGNYAEISYNLVAENYAESYGAGVYIDEGARADIHHDLIVGNGSKQGCEAVSAIGVDGGQNGGSQAMIRHCTIAGNMCPDSVRGNGIQVEGQSEVTVRDCIFWNNSGDDFAVDGISTLNVTYTCSQEPIAGVGNITVDPMFVNAGGGDYRLAPGSPCIDAGDPASPYSNEPAPNGGRADMGRFGDTEQAGESDGSGGNGNGNDNGTTENGNDNAAGNDNGSSNDNAADNDNGTDNDGPTGNSNEDGGSGADNVNDNSDPGGHAASALCPTTAAMLLGLSFLGVRRRTSGA